MDGGLGLGGGMDEISRVGTWTRAVQREERSRSRSRRERARGWTFWAGGLLGAPGLGWAASRLRSCPVGTWSPAALAGGGAGGCPPFVTSGAVAGGRWRQQAVPVVAVGAPEAVVVVVKVPCPSGGGGGCGGCPQPGGCSRWRVSRCESQWCALARPGHRCIWGSEAASAPTHCAGTAPRWRKDGGRRDVPAAGRSTRGNLKLVFLNTRRSIRRTISSCSRSLACRPRATTQSWQCAVIAIPRCVTVKSESRRRRR